jgi:phosphoribosylamine--glycine ligase/phosphoribosylformylglycinamidine cyclo-ligase
MAPVGEITTFPSPASDLKVLLLGAGGREHALAYKLAQSPRVSNVFVCPGNGGTAIMGGKVSNVALPWGGKNGYEAVVAWAKEQQLDLVVPGPEQPLVEGVEVLLRKGGFCKDKYRRSQN